MHAVGKKGGGSRFTTPKLRNIMSGILLTPGPISTRKAVKSLSSVFNLSVTKTKFEAAAKNLVTANLGTNLSDLGSKHSFTIFLKKKPDEIREFLQLPENADLCSIEEYIERYHLKTPSYNIPGKTLGVLLQRGIVNIGQFKA